MLGPEIAGGLGLPYAGPTLSGLGYLWGMAAPAAPAAPESLTATPADGEVVLSWFPVDTATTYTLYRSTEPGVTPTTGTAMEDVESPYADDGVVNGTHYYYVVTASNAGGESLASAEAMATPAAPITRVTDWIT